MSDEKKLSMEEKLERHYKITLELGNGGHAVGFYAEPREEIISEYVFERGKFVKTIIRDSDVGSFVLFGYDPL
jgi:hypothetical protein